MENVETNKLLKHKGFSEHQIAEDKITVQDLHSAYGTESIQQIHMDTINHLINQMNQHRESRNTRLRSSGNTEDWMNKRNERLADLNFEKRLARVEHEVSSQAKPPNIPSLMTDPPKARPLPAALKNLWGPAKGEERQGTPWSGADWPKTPDTSSTQKEKDI